VPLIEYMAAALVLVLGLAAGPLLRNALLRLAWPWRQSFRVGDLVSIGQHRGVVEALGWQRVRLRGPAGEQISVPNSFLLREPMVWLGREKGSASVHLRLAVGQHDLERARHAAWQAAALSPYLALDRPIAVHLEQDERGRMTLRLEAGVFEQAQAAWFTSSVIAAYDACLREGGKAILDRGG
jgi:hypothetical protein